MRTLVDLVGELGARRSRGTIYAGQPFVATSPAVVHHPESVLGPPDGLAPFLDADLAHEYLRAWSAWQPTRPTPDAAVVALVAFSARPRVAAARVAAAMVDAAKVDAARPGAVDVPRAGAFDVPRPGLRATTGSGRVYDEPTDDIVYQLVLELESGQERSLVLRRSETASSATTVEVTKEAGGPYGLEQRDGSGHQVLVEAKMPTALLRLTDWAFRGRDISSRESRTPTG